MLILTRRAGQRILIGQDIVVSVLELEGSRVKIGIDAPSGIVILREEIEARPGDTGPEERPRAEAFGTGDSPGSGDGPSADTRVDPRGELGDSRGEHSSEDAGQDSSAEPDADSGADGNRDDGKSAGEGSWKSVA